MARCELCAYDRTKAIYACEDFFVIDACEQAYPGYVRLVAQEHRKELTDFEPRQRKVFYEAMLVIESVMRDVMAPDKVNWAQFGNMVPHLHWHAIPRYAEDAHFPQAVWAPPVRQVDSAALEARRMKARRFFEELAGRLEERFG